MTDKKTIAIIILSLALLVVSYIAFWSEPLPYDDALIQVQKKKLEQVNDSLLNEIKSEQKKQVAFVQKIDSLQGLKPKIIIKYITKYNEIDNSSVSGVVNEFDSLFSKSGVK